ncbi:hypothetical protein CKAN_00009900 [Cinnamomum micranthum f. kanehirae]|uniref:Uncharacterized protein n=1 Tax=Cinnamomum micranthum f. kanehirae TaxID=337451 RepID=A0A3S4N2F9_9MAGN|nr:hypothetical protein CKAN_00009900 [Cinnamomum micranthum f. kanehirae]
MVSSLKRRASPHILGYLDKGIGDCERDSMGPSQQIISTSLEGGHETQIEKRIRICRSNAADEKRHLRLPNTKIVEKLVWRSTLDGYCAGILLGTWSIDSLSPEGRRAQEFIADWLPRIRESGREARSRAKRPTFLSAAIFNRRSKALMSNLENGTIVF